MAYTPDPYDNAQPVASVAASTLPAELRAIKTALIGRKNASETNASDIVALDAALAALAAQVAAGKRWALLTSTTEDTFTVPAGVTELLIIAIGGGQGGQGGGQAARFRGHIQYSLGLNNTVNVYGPYSNYYGLGERAHSGKPGGMVVQTVAVTPEEELTYICGGGSVGGAAAATALKDVNSSNMDRYLAEPGNSNDFNYDWYIYSLDSTRAALELTGVTEVNGVPTSKTFDALITGKCRHAGQVGGNVGYRSNRPYATYASVTLDYGSLAADGGDTRFGIPANPNDPALAEIAGGGQQGVGHQGLTAGLFGSNFGRGGVGGTNATNANTTPGAGTAGGDGAILVMW